jgi:hypothetical protein
MRSPAFIDIFLSFVYVDVHSADAIEQRERFADIYRHIAMPDENTD